MKYVVEKNLDLQEVESKLKRLYETTEIRTLAVLFLHSYSLPDHELAFQKIASEIGFTHISLSSQIMPMVKAVPRGLTACVDAYLTPCINTYLKGFCSGFENLDQNKVNFMQSDGGLAGLDNFTGSRAILSGPAGGVVGYAMTTEQTDEESNLPIIGFDMGGTSTDVSRYAGRYEHVFETTTAGVTIQAPQLDINTVAAGGGSRLFYRAGLFVVGPESAGSEPGPVCYRKPGGVLAVTDANVALGRVLPEYFPKIFGPNKDQMLDKEASIEALTKIIPDSSNNYSWEETALGFLDVANEAMCRPIRAITQAKGYDTSKHILATFGGAGGQHCCAIARSLGMQNVFVHKYAGILSAYGMALADVVHEEQEPANAIYQDQGENSNLSKILSRAEIISEKGIQNLKKSGQNFLKIKTELFLNMRFEKTDFGLMISEDDARVEDGSFKKAFEKRYKSEFGFILKDRNIYIDDIRVRCVGISEVQFSASADSVSKKRKVSTAEPKPDTETKTYFKKKKWLTTPVFDLENLLPYQTISGPAIIMNGNSTILIEPDCQAFITENFDISIKIDLQKSASETKSDLCDPIQLSIFSHRFMSIAEQMGRRLQRTAISTNIKERLDFSCALFGPDGGLVSNAPHIPVHLGAMQQAVKFQIEQVELKKLTIEEGDVILSNHPCAGGSHLPDLTVITPVFLDGEIVFFVANRGHHADIGGSTPGSMPSNSTSLRVF